MNEKQPLSAKDRKNLAKQRKQVAKQAQKYHKEQEKQNKKSSTKFKSYSNSKIQKAVDARSKNKRENLSREEKFLRESEEKIRNLEPKDFDDGYYIDEFSARRNQRRRVKEIQEQESEVIYRNRKPLTQKQLKVRRILIYSSILAVVLIIGLILSLTVLFKTEKIEVVGDKYYYEEQIIGFSSVELQQNIFIATIGSTPEDIIENLSYVEEAKVSFNIPDTVTIKITNAVPSYVIKNGNSYLLISSKGRILENIASNEDKLPELKCDKLMSTKVGDYVSFEDKNVPDILEEVSNSLRKNKFENIAGFDITDTANITLNYDNRIEINIGLPEDIDYKIRTALTIINEKLDPNKTGTVTGTLDVSACNTTKMSHYKPLEGTEPPTTVPSTTAPTTADVYSDTSQTGDYTWDSTDSYDDTYTDETYSDEYYSGDTYTDDTYTDDTYSGDTYTDDTYTDDTYSDGYYSDDTYTDDAYTDQSYYDDSYTDENVW